MDKAGNPSVLLSVVSPVYNGSAYLTPFLESVLHQTFRDFELIMVDDGSADESLEIIQTYQEKDACMMWGTKNGPLGLVEKGLKSSTF